MKLIERWLIILRIPKLFLEQTNLGEEVELEVEDDHIIIRPTTYPRQGWSESFKEMAEHGDDQLLDGETPPGK